MQGVGTYEREGDDVHVQGAVQEDPHADYARCILDDEPDVLLVYTSTEKQGVYWTTAPPGWSRQVVDAAGRVGGVPRPVPERVQRGAGEDDADGGQRADPGAPCGGAR